MRKGILIGSIIVLSGLIFIEYAIFAQLRRSCIVIKEKYISSQDNNKTAQIGKSLKTSMKEYGYGDIMDVLNYEKSLKILRIEKINQGDNNIGIGFEFIGSEEDFKKLGSRLSSMGNFIGINKLFIKNTGDGNKNIQLYTEFKVFYAK